MKMWAFDPKIFSKLTLMSKNIKNIFSSYSKRFRLSLWCLFAVLTIFSCGDDIEVPDVSNIEVDVEMIRFDQLFQNIDTLQVESSLNTLKEKYPEFTPLFCNRILPLADPKRPNDKLQCICFHFRVWVPNFYY